MVGLYLWCFVGSLYGVFVLVHDTRQYMRHIANLIDDVMISQHIDVIRTALELDVSHKSNNLILKRT